MERYGFIYIWRDRKHCRYYIGYHWGSETDGYICSSNSMREAYKRRHRDFKRRIIKKGYTTKVETAIEEQRWLDMIKPKEFGKKYYNLNAKTQGIHLQNYKHSDETKKKISLGNKDKIISEKTKELLRQANKKQFEDPIQREIRRIKSLALWQDPTYRAKTSVAHRGKKQSKETIQKRKQTNIQLGTYERWSKERTGKTFEELYGNETAAIAKQKISQKFKGKPSTRKGRPDLQPRRKPNI